MIYLFTESSVFAEFSESKRFYFRNHTIANVSGVFTFSTDHSEGIFIPFILENSEKIF